MMVSSAPKTSNVYQCGPHSPGKFWGNIVEYVYIYLHYILNMDMLGKTLDT